MNSKAEGQRFEPRLVTMCFDIDVRNDILNLPRVLLWEIKLRENKHTLRNNSMMCMTDSQYILGPYENGN